MALRMGIVGLPNVGKSTTFNALTKEQNAEVANYPFCTIEPNRAIVPLPDRRLDRLATLTGVPNTIYATIEFVDIAGLVKGASQGEGLGNQFLAQIRDVDAIVHVVRCFDDENIVHVNPTPEPRADIETVNLELVMADLEQVNRKLERLERQVKGDKKLLQVQALAESVRTHLEAGESLTTFAGRDSEAFHALDMEMRFLTAKPVIFVANVDEEGLAKDNAYVQTVRAVAGEQGAEVVKLCAELEEEMAGMSDEERHEFLAVTGASESGLEQMVRKSFDLLGLITFFTFNEREVRAWELAAGSAAPEAAGTIHTDLQRGFIRAEVAPFTVFEEHGSWQAVRAAGALRSEGKEYVVQDGDVIFFRFNV